MGLYGAVWGYMGLHGTAWCSMGLYGAAQNPARRCSWGSLGAGIALLRACGEEEQSHSPTTAFWKGLAQFPYWNLPDPFVRLL